MKNRLAFFILIAFLSIPPFVTLSYGQSIIRTVNGTVTKVSDGDTVNLETPEQTILKVRLYGIDAPETEKVNNRTSAISKTGQPYGEEAKNALEKKVMGKKVKLDILDIDKYRRMVGIIYIEDRNINLEMVREGYAEAYIEYLKVPYRKEFLEAEKEARSDKKGIWSLSGYERPSVFRKRIKIRGTE